MFVTVVPMLAPMIIGTAVGTPIAPPPTSPTIVEVETDEDWTSTVARMPAKRPASGWSTLSSSPSWNPSPSAWMPASNIETPARKP